MKKCLAGLCFVLMCVALARCPPVEAQSLAFVQGANTVATATATTIAAAFPSNVGAANLIAVKVGWDKIDGADITATVGDSLGNPAYTQVNQIEQTGKGRLVHRPQA